MATQSSGMEAWYYAIQERDTIIGQVRQENSTLRERLGEYAKALDERDEIIRALRNQLAGMQEQQPPAMETAEVSAEMPGAPPPVPTADALPF